MKIKNDYIKIKLGDKKVEIHNLILNNYLARFVERQTDTSKINKNMSLIYCFIKFDTAISFNESSEISMQSFDILLPMFSSNVKQEISPTTVKVEYQYTGTEVLNISSQQLVNIKTYAGRKIMTIGFSTSMLATAKMNAMLDTSNYNLYIEQNSDLVISRKDTISSDGILAQKTNKVEGMVHLMPRGMEPLISNEAYGVKYYAHGILFSVGLNIDPKMDTELIIGSDVNINIGSNYIEMQLINTKRVDKETFTGKSYCGINYCRNANNRYIIFKYRIYQTVLSGSTANPTETLTNTGENYCVAIPISSIDFGTKTIKIKYERS